VILVDTGPFVALCRPRDPYHRTATRDLGQLEGDPFSTCEAVLVEAAFHLRTRGLRQRLRAVLDELDVTIVDAAMARDEIFDWLDKYAEHEPDWADACIAVLSGHNAALSVWTYDKEFRTTWRRSDGTRIPLAPG
jgi:predicted nucleic acid-binding protein